MVNAAPDRIIVWIDNRVYTPAVPDEAGDFIGSFRISNIPFQKAVRDHSIQDFALRNTGGTASPGSAFSFSRGRLFLLRCAKRPDRMGWIRRRWDKVTDELFHRVYSCPHTVEAVASDAGVDFKEIESPSMRVPLNIKVGETCVAC